MEPFVFITNSLVVSGDLSFMRRGPCSAGIHSLTEKMSTERDEVNPGLANGPVDVYFGFAEACFLTW